MAPGRVPAYTTGVRSLIELPRNSARPAEFPPCSVHEACLACAVPFFFGGLEPVWTAPGRTPRVSTTGARPKIELPRNSARPAEFPPCSVHIQLQPAGGGVVFPGADKLFHAAEFAVFALLAWKAFRRRLAPALLATLLFAALDEFHQSFVPTRDASVLDGLADAVGAVLALVVARRSAVLWAFLRRRILSQTNSTRGI
ncbi:VanZ family protein [Candidatus Bipolaricaulota bacterium]